MPLYRCLVPNDRLTYAQREEVAQTITQIHCKVTGAPKTFVHVFMFEEPGRTEFDIGGSIREGRTEEQKNTLITEMRAGLATTASVEIDQVTMTTTDVPARWTMEGGDVLPEPGEEGAWLAKHAEK